MIFLLTKNIFLKF